MDARRLDRRITLERQDDAVQTAFGDQPGAFFPFAQVWAEHTPISDGERMRAQGTAATSTDRFLIRWSSEVANLSSAHQLVFEGRRHAIDGVKPTNGRRPRQGAARTHHREKFLEITATAQADTGALDVAP